MKEYAKTFYKGKQWIKISHLYMEHQHYICERCGGVATICHHKIYISPANIHDPAITLSFDNLEALCQECHNKEHFLKYNTAIFDENGNMIGVKENAELKEYKKTLKKLEFIKNTAYKAHKAILENTEKNT